MGELSEKFEEVSRFFQRPINEVLPPSLLLYLVPPLPSFRLAAALLVLAVLLSLRVWWILPARKSRTKSRVAAITKPQDPWTVGVFLGSGGHTTELLQLVSALPTERYTQRIYLLSSGDRFSLHKAQDLERTLSCGSTDKPMAKTIQIPRARKVHQRFLTTPLTLARSVLFCIDHIAIRPLLRKSVGSSDKRQSSKGILADVLLMNGPGTCVPIVASVYLLRILGLPSPKLIYVESFARVKSFSLTARLVRPFVDQFVLQWPRNPHTVGAETKANATSNTVYSGWLV